jgi:uncharacterized membrane protein YfcA
MDGSSERHELHVRPVWEHPPSDEKALPAKDYSPVTVTAPVESVPPLVLPATATTSRKKMNTALGIAIVAPLASLAILGVAVLTPMAGRALVAAEVQWSIALAGFLAQIVDGSLGMGYGITSATVLTSIAGLSPMMASSAVHLAQLGTTALSGYSHKKCGNIEEPTLRLLTPSGVVGALLGSTLLSSLDTSTAKLVSGTTLFAVGMYVLLRFAATADDVSSVDTPRGKPSPFFLAPLGFVGGCVDAMGGGGWGPVATSGLLAEGRLPPSAVIGTVSLSEFFVTVAAVVGFALLGPAHAGGDTFRYDLALTLLGGGLLAAPVAPLLVRRVPARRLGMIVGGFICATNVRVVMRLGLRALARFGA